MRCTHCDYLLFNLTRNDCPECGQPYHTADYRFAAGAVSFHCPHCDQAYFGNDAQGLPAPRAFACAKCGNPISLEQLRVVPENDAAMGWIGSVWDNRKVHGLWSSWWRTFKQTALQPTSFYREHVGRSTREAWLFSMISLYIGMIPSMAIQFLLMVAMSTSAVQNALQLPGAAAPGATPPIWLFGLAYGAMALLFPLFIQLVIGGIWSLTIQVGLWLLVPHRKGLDVTFRATLYSFGAYAMYAVPVCGGSVAGIWQMVILINGIKTVHETTGWRASIAVLWVVVAFIVVYVAVFAVIVGAALTSQGGLGS